MVDLRNLKKRNLFVNKCIQNVHVEKSNIPLFRVVMVKSVFSCATMPAVDYRVEHPVVYLVY